MLENEFNNILLGFILVFASLPFLEANSFWFRYYPSINQYPVNNVFGYPPSLNKEQARAALVSHVVDTLIGKPQRQSRYENTIQTDNCARLFGSIYGTKQQKKLCLEKLKRKKLDSENTFKTGFNKPIPFLDLTRAIDIIDSAVRSKKRNIDFARDYIDIDDLKSMVDMRRANYKRKRGLVKRSSYVSDSDSDSDSSVDVTQRNVKSTKKAKRFQVIDNGETKESGDDDSDSFAAESKETVKPNTKFVLNNDYSQDSDDSSEVEYEKPVKTNTKKEYYIQNEEFSEIETIPVTKKKKSFKNGKKEYYIQGGRILNPNSDEDGRRRLPSFMPKRFHWGEEEIQNLGYYWFNGPQGRYPYLPVRP